MEKNKKEILRIDVSEDGKDIYYFVYLDGNLERFNALDIRDKIFEKYKNKHMIDYDFDIKMCNFNKMEIVYKDTIVPSYRIMMVYRR